MSKQPITCLEPSVSTIFRSNFSFDHFNVLLYRQSHDLSADASGKSMYPACHSIVALRILTILTHFFSLLLSLLSFWCLLVTLYYLLYNVGQCSYHRPEIQYCSWYRWYKSRNIHGHHSHYTTHSSVVELGCLARHITSRNSKFKRWLSCNFRKVKIR